MKKIILIVCGIIIVAILGRVGWAYLQAKNDEIRMANAPAIITTEATVNQDHLVDGIINSTNSTPANVVDKSISPKETLLMLTYDFNNLVKLFIPEPAKNPQDLAMVFDSVEFKQFINKYATADIEKKLGAVSGFNKGGLVFTIGASLPDANAVINESIVGDTVTLSYDKEFNGTKTVQGVTSTTSWTAKCIRQMVLENNMWKISTEAGSCR